MSETIWIKKLGIYVKLFILLYLNLERTYSLKQSIETIQLLNSDDIDKNIKNFSFIHFGLL